MLPDLPRMTQPPIRSAAARPRDVRLFGAATAVSATRRRVSALHSHVVSLLKLVLPAVALGLVALVLLWPQLNPIDPGFRLRPVAVSMDDLENLRMVNPRYVGTDKQNQPYSVTADQATQVSGDSNVTDLVKPKGDMTLKQGAWIALSAEAGLYRKHEQSLDLEGNVNLFHDTGYELVTARARINLDQGTAEGNDPVVGHGPDMELQGQGFRVHDRGERILMTGRSRLLIRPAAVAQK
jgi:lipopolysaccharide export system protein LptC